MAKNLLIVESPSKIKTIEKILGDDYKVVSSVGHIRDLEKGDAGVDIAHDFHPNYVISPDKIKVVKNLRDEVKIAGEVWLATDDDREGEAISWHLCEVLKLDKARTKRIVFREITKPAIQKAILSPRTVDIDLVNAQQARRILDRLVGFELSGLLWRKIKAGLSAGRVQSVTVKLVVNREREIQQFVSTPFFKIEAQFDVKNALDKIVLLKAEAKNRTESEGDARTFLEKCKNAVYTIRNIDVKPTKRKPTAPFITSTLQQEASRKLGFSVNRTMQNAQRLYEAGHITYMRTDSTNLSETAIADIAQEITKSFGANYVQIRRFKTGKESAQEAHEAIRPTYIEKRDVASDRDEQRLYELIWKRAIASQMADAELEKTTVDINISTQPNEKLIAEGEVLKFDGFLKVYLESKDDDDDEAKGTLPPLKVGQLLDFNEMRAVQRFTRPPARFTEAALIKELEELGIGRPSTYAATITKIMEENRGYVVKETRDGTPRAFQILKLDKKNSISSETGSEMTGALKNHLVPTDMGMLVVDFLNKHFDEVMNYTFTAEVEDKLDQIADGKRDWVDMLKNFYNPFHSDVEKTRESADRASGERVLGKEPGSNKTILVRMGKYGPVAQRGNTEELAEDEKPQFASLMKGQSIETITLPEVLKLFDLPKSLGTFEGKEIIVGIGRFGPYVKVGETFVSLPDGENAIDVNTDRAVELYNEKVKADAPLFMYKNVPVTKGTGRFGPFLKWNNLYINIPKKFNPEFLSEVEAIEIIDAKVEKEGNRFILQFPEEQITVENGRWGPFIRFGKSMINVKVNGKKITAEESAHLTLDQIKAMVIEEVPNAFEKKEKAPAKTKAVESKSKTAVPKAKAAPKVKAKPAPPVKPDTRNQTVFKRF